MYNAHAMYYSIYLCLATGRPIIFPMREWLFSQGSCLNFGSCCYFPNLLNFFWHTYHISNVRVTFWAKSGGTTNENSFVSFQAGAIIMLLPGHRSFFKPSYIYIYIYITHMKLIYQWSALAYDSLEQGGCQGEWKPWGKEGRRRRSLGQVSHWNVTLKRHTKTSH
jgi:hypothetical protein